MPQISMSKDDIAEKGEAIYNSRLRSQLEPSLVGKFVAIDVISGENAVGDTVMQATDALAARILNPECYIMKIGYTAAVAMGGRLTRR